ncbi:MAG: ParB/RepB/Spo0J family partition protein, partial [Phycisphaerae bacterium]
MSTNTIEKPETGLVLFSINAIQPAPENDKVYAPVNSDDPAFIAFAADIKEHGIMNPLLVSADHYIISGHRRYAAAKACGFRTVPCRISGVSRAESPDEFMA